jgi:hypothetical protein
MIYNFQEKLSSIYYMLNKNDAYCMPQKNYHFYDKFELEELLVIAMKFSRRNIRLLYILVDYFVRKFKVLKVFYFKDLLDKETFAILGIISEFCKIVKKDKEILDFFHVLLNDYKCDKPYELFNIGDFFSFKYAKKCAYFSLYEYKKWHFYGIEIPMFSHYKAATSSATYEQATRANIISDLLKNNKKIKTSEYLEKLNYSITRQQAHIDLINYPKIKFSGEKKGRIYFL